MHSTVVASVAVMIAAHSLLHSQCRFDHSCIVHSCKFRIPLQVCLKRQFFNVNKFNVQSKLELYVDIPAPAGWEFVCGLTAVTSSTEKKTEKIEKITHTQARREGGGRRESFPGPATFGGPRRRSKILKMVCQVASF